MLELPTTLLQKFDSLLLKRSFFDEHRADYKKWLRFYWVFCHKYQHDIMYGDSDQQQIIDENESMSSQKNTSHSVRISLSFMSRQQPLK